ncbi:MAG: response regulator [Planctomycetes bacterium]|nr:response regulator [Planctomycetota bacterium]
MGKKFTLEELVEIQKKFEEMFLEKDTYFLLVDRQIGSRRGLKNALVKAGAEDHYILEANDAMDATIQASRNQNTFVVFTELKLPDTDADKLVERIKSKPGHENDVFVLVTGEKSDARFKKAVQAGITAHLPKPIVDTEVASLAKKLKLV